MVLAGLEGVGLILCEVYGLPCVCVFPLYRNMAPLRRAPPLHPGKKVGCICIVYITHVYICIVYITHVYCTYRPTPCTHMYTQLHTNNTLHTEHARIHIRQGGSSFEMVRLKQTMLISLEIVHFNNHSRAPQHCSCQHQVQYM